MEITRHIPFRGICDNSLAFPHYKIIRLAGNGYQKKVATRFQTHQSPALTLSIYLAPNYIRLYAPEGDLSTPPCIIWSLFLLVRGSEECNLGV